MQHVGDIQEPVFSLSPALRISDFKVIFFWLISVENGHVIPPRVYLIGSVFVTLS